MSPATKHSGMKTWYSLSLGDGMTSGAVSAEIEELFVRLFTEADWPPSMAVFTRPESEGRLHCEVIAYFSPDAGRVADAFHANPCEPPARAGLSLLAGVQAAWSALFPESR